MSVVKRGRRRITCEVCGRGTTTLYPPETGDLCLQCRAKGQNHPVPDAVWAPRRPVGRPKIILSKHELEARLFGGGRR